MVYKRVRAVGPRGRASQCKHLLSTPPPGLTWVDRTYRFVCTHEFWKLRFNKRITHLHFQLVVVCLSQDDFKEVCGDGYTVDTNQLDIVKKPGKLETAEIMSRTLVSWCLHEKTRTGARFIQGWLLDFVSRLHVCMFSFRRPMAHDQYDDTTLKRRKLTTHALPVVVH